MKNIIALFCGLIFGFGLTLAQMTDPQKVLNFLDIAGQWDPSLAFVMGGGLLVFGVGYVLLIKPRRHAWTGDDLPELPRSTIDAPLCIGALLFGVGWGVSGVCPGPAIANTTSFDPIMLGFIACMLVGLLLGNQLKKRMS